MKRFYSILLVCLALALCGGCKVGIDFEGYLPTQHFPGGGTSQDPRIDRKRSEDMNGGTSANRPASVKTERKAESGAKPEEFEQMD
jgi:hypothetical protein